MSSVESFPPVVSHNSKALVLGSMPGAASLRAGEYYAHPRNAFWSIMADMLGADCSLPYAARLQRLDAAGVALWDSLQSCVRPGSLDSSISAEVGNDFRTFFAAYPNITHVFFNGRKAEQAFLRHVLPSLSDPPHGFMCLPSTSPAHAAVPFAAKVNAWSVVRDVVGSSDPLR